MLYGTMANSPHKACISYHVRGGPPFEGEPPLRWNMYGTQGELEVVNPGFMAASVIKPGARIRLHEFQTNEVQNIDWSLGDAAEKNLPPPAQNVSRLYEAFANGETEKLVSFEEAVKRHRMVDEMEKEFRGRA